MPETVRLCEDVPLRGGYEVVVAGGGVAGVAAALAARRAGKKVLLIEKTNLLGGLATIGLINLFVPMCNGRGRQIIHGMAEEFLRLSIRNGYDTLPAAWRDGQPAQPTNERYVTRFSAQIFALELLGLVVGEGVDILLDCIASTPVMRDGRCQGLILENKSGRQYVEAGVVIDATGDADLLFRAGAPTVQGRNFYTYLAFAATVESCRKAADSGMIRDMYAKRYMPGPADLYGRGHPEGMRHFLGTDVDDITDYLVTCQRELLSLLSSEPAGSGDIREIPTLPTMPQFRTTRRLDGDYALRVEDAYVHFDDAWIPADTGGVEDRASPDIGHI